MKISVTKEADVYVGDISPVNEWPEKVEEEVPEQNGVEAPEENKNGELDGIQLESEVDEEPLEEVEPEQEEKVSSAAPKDEAVPED